MGKPRLMDQVRDAVRSRHYSIRTEQCYAYWIRRFILFHGKRHPAEMGEVEITAFLTDLAVEKHVSASTRIKRCPPSFSFTSRYLGASSPGWGT